MTNGKAWRKMRNPAVKIATQSAPKLNPRSPVCTERARIPRRTAGPLGCSNSSKGEENSPTRPSVAQKSESCQQYESPTTSQSGSFRRRSVPIVAGSPRWQNSAVRLCLSSTTGDGHESRRQNAWPLPLAHGRFSLKDQCVWQDRARNRSRSGSDAP